MQSYFERRIDDAKKIGGDGDVRLYVVSTVRLLLQQVIYGLLEWSSRQPTQENIFSPAELTNNAIRPSDGTLVDLLETSAIYAEQVGWQGITQRLYSAIPDEAACRSICEESDASIISLLRGIVRMRNDGAEGHGLPGDYNRVAETNSLSQLLESLAPLLPRTTADSQLEIGPVGKETQAKFLRLVDGAPLLVRAIKILDGSKVRVDAQYIDQSNRRQTVRFEAWNPFARLNAAPIPRFSPWPNLWNPLVYLPDRTTESFQGRESEQRQIAEWMDDSDSRTCLVYGDGGVGKTTLVVELLHRLLNEDPDLAVRWKPKVVSFFTAKKWRWGLEGVELVAAGQPHLMGLMLHLHYLLLGRAPPADFYRLDVAQAAIRLQQHMKSEVSLTRDDHIVVVDNTETLIASDKDVEQLGRELREISRRVGRVIITSRRREVLEATPVAVDKFDSLDAVKLLKRRAKVLEVRAILKASDTALLDLVKDVGTKPIVLEALLQAFADPATRSLEAAKIRVRSMLKKDLGEFLFADAWARYSSQMKRMLLLMVRVGDVLDARQLAICSEVCGASMPSAEEALEESSGIASIIRLGSGVEVAFSPNFVDFAREKHVVIDGVEYPRNVEIEEVRRQYSRFVQAVRSFSGDRISAAFRTPLAKAAHRARNEGDQKEALRLYQQAILSDPENGWLFDRFAYFLFHDQRDNAAALVQARRATELLPNEGEVWFTRGLIESRTGQYRQCENSLSKAESLGIDKLRCSSQRAWAYLKTKPALLNLARSEIGKLRQALANVAHSDRNWVETETLMSRLQYLESRGRDVRG